MSRNSIRKHVLFGTSWAVTFCVILLPVKYYDCAFFGCVTRKCSTSIWLELVSNSASPVSWLSLVCVCVPNVFLYEFLYLKYISRWLLLIQAAIGLISALWIYYVFTFGFLETKTKYTAGFYLLLSYLIVSDVLNIWMVVDRNRYGRARGHI